MRQNMPRMSLLDVDVDAEANAAGAAAEAVSNLSTHNGSNLMCERVCVCVWAQERVRGDKHGVGNSSHIPAN